MDNTNIIGVYEDEDVLLKAIDQLQENDIKILDVYSPIPIHGVFEKLKLTTRLPYATFIYGAIGAISVFAFLYWTSVVSYPLKFGGKPLNTLSFIIIMFVLTIFVGTLFTFLTYFIREKMYPGKKVTMPVPRTTNDQFAILIEMGQAMSAAEIKKVNDLLKKTGAVEIKESE
ncbi:MAG: hypothetical protein C0591_12000 [Marinilabiliales bacterium]|jgi:hypothetical protein|nr:MAG: hypothetical protein C0591_12000 [Marinilabiliales bacterium]